MLTQDLIVQLQLSLALAQCTKVEVEPFTGNMKMYFPPEVLADYNQRLSKKEQVALPKSPTVKTSLGPIVELIPIR